ncbi:MAG: TetR/AcrR family transcriptional regulator [Bacteroidota bacterium]
MRALSFRLNPHLYLRDPQHTELGMSIIKKSVELIDQLGFEQFTFKKLSEEIHCTEASVYRYFENKHRLLHYLTAWYWSWLEYRIDLALGSLRQPEEKLRACLRVLTEEKKFDPTFAFVDEEALNRIVVAELDKTYLTKWVDSDNKEGLFLGFKSLCNRIADLLLKINPQYPYSESLASTLLLAVKQQLFFADHLPTLSSMKRGKKMHETLYQFVENMALGTIKNY